MFKIKYVGWCHACKYYGPEGGFTSNEIASWFVDHNHQYIWQQTMRTGVFFFPCKVLYCGYNVEIEKLPITANIT